MKLILDEGVPRQITLYLSGHGSTTVQARGWASAKNGRLLELIESEGFDAFVTCDKNMEFQQVKLAGRPFAVLLLTTNHLPTILPNAARIVEALDKAEPGTIITVDVGLFVPRKLRKSV
jgi:predicted nuclease of predicted toxin-antitoxin system